MFLENTFHLHRFNFLIQMPYTMQYPYHYGNIKYTKASPLTFEMLSEKEIMTNWVIKSEKKKYN